MYDEISMYIGDDAYAPPIPKPSLQQYDNYQIYDMYCFDTLSQRNSTKNGIEILSKTNIRTIAVQAYSPSPILCNFDAIVRRYP